MPGLQGTRPAGVANAVAINIFNPQAYGAPSGAQPMQNSQFQGLTSPYQMPFAPMYSNNAITNPMAYQQFMPVQNIMNAPAFVPAEPYFVAPAPMEMPASVLPPSEMTAQVPEAPVIEVAPEAPAAVQEVVAPAVEVVQPEQTAQVVDVDGLVQGLKSADASVRMETINKLAAYAQEAPEIAYQIVSEPVMQSLVGIIQEDTSKLAGPTKEQNAVAEKIAKGETLTPEEQALAEQISPLDMANHNRTIALYTLAMIQKLQRDELNQYIANQVANGEQPCTPLSVQDLIGYEANQANIFDVIKNDPSLKVRIAAIEGLGHILEPNDKAIVEPILVEAQKSSNEDIKAAATDALAKFAA